MDPFIAPDAFATPRFTLRSYLPGDGPALNEATLSSYEHLRPWMPWATTEQTPTQAEALVRQFRGRWLLATDFVLAAFSPDGAQLLGGAGFHLRNGPLASRSAEMGMWVRASHAGAGLGSAMLEAMLEWGFTEWPWERLTWKCDARNRASARVAEKAGLRIEGTFRHDERDVTGALRDTRLYAIRIEEWQARRG